MISWRYFCSEPCSRKRRTRRATSASFVTTAPALAVAPKIFSGIETETVRATSAPTRRPCRACVGLRRVFDDGQVVWRRRSQRWVGPRVARRDARGLMARVRGGVRGFDFVYVNRIRDWSGARRGLLRRRSRRLRAGGEKGVSGTHHFVACADAAGRDGELDRRRPATDADAKNRA